MSKKIKNNNELANSKSEMFRAVVVNIYKDRKKSKEKEKEIEIRRMKHITKGKPIEIDNSQGDPEKDFCEVWET